MKLMVDEQEVHCLTEGVVPYTVVKKAEQLKHRVNQSGRFTTAELGIMIQLAGMHGYADIVAKCIRLQNAQIEREGKSETNSEVKEN